MGRPHRRRATADRPIARRPALRPLLESSAVSDRESWVARKSAVPYRPGAAHIGRTATGFAELGVPAGRAEPGLGPQLAPGRLSWLGPGLARRWSRWPGVRSGSRHFSYPCRSKKKWLRICDVTYPASRPGTPADGVHSQGYSLTMLPVSTGAPARAPVGVTADPTRLRWLRLSRRSGARCGARAGVPAA